MPCCYPRMYPHPQERPPNSILSQLVGSEEEGVDTVSALSFVLLQCKRYKRFPK
jgi:hypothetical protein